MPLKRGLTPAELLATVSLISLLLLAVSARVLAGHGTAGSEDLLERVHVLLQYARLEAVGRATECSLEIDSRSGRSRIIESDSGDLIHETHLGLIEQVAAADRNGAPRGDRSIRIAFGPTGHPVSEASGVLLRTDRVHGAIWVEQGGEISVEDFRTVHP